MAVFTWLPDHGLTKQVKTRSNKMSFGDGYEQRVADGINTLKESWNPSFSLRTRTEIDAIDAFLVARKGVESFDWVSPSGVQKRFKCEEWAPLYNHNGDCSLSATFMQVFET